MVQGEEFRVQGCEPEGMRMRWPPGKKGVLGLGVHLNPEASFPSWLET